MSKYLLIAVVALGFVGCRATKNNATRLEQSEAAKSEVVVEDTVGVIDHHAVTYSYLSKRLGLDLGKDDKEHISLYETSARWIGTPYRYGGSSRSGCDCSGLVVQIYKSVYHKKLERNSAAMKERNCTVVKKNEIEPGDLVFFSTGKKGRINHVGIVLKGKKFIHSSTSRGVIVSDLGEKYYRQTFVCAGRVKGL